MHYYENTVVVKWLIYFNLGGLMDIRNLGIFKWEMKKRARYSSQPHRQRHWSPSLSESTSHQDPAVAMFSPSLARRRRWLLPTENPLWLAKVTVSAPLKARRKIPELKGSEHWGKILVGHWPHWVSGLALSLWCSSMSKILAKTIWKEPWAGTLSFWQCLLGVLGKIP